MGNARGLRCLGALLTFCVGTLAVVNVPPSTNWDGNDGPWSSFTVQIGTPPQAVRVFPSTSGSSIWAVAPEGCTVDDPSDCPDLRGWTFDSSASSTVVEKGIYDLPLDTEKKWGYTGNGRFAFDEITLSYSGGGGPVLNNTLFGSIATKDFLIGTMGLAPWGVNFTNFNNPIPSLLTSLKDAGHIRSNSWSYTAGANYKAKQSFGSLTFGGYDASRFEPNDLTFPRGEDISRDLLVGIQSITSGQYSLLPKGVIALIDSTIAQIWLPIESCTRFEEVFGLTWDDDLELYLVNDTLHDQLTTSNPKITFTLGITATSRKIINIDLPYGAFDLTASWPLTGNTTSRYFPLRRAANNSQIVLGRTFLQQAYLTVDYDRNNFTVSQALFPNANTPQRLVEILPPKSSHPHQLKQVYIIVIGVVVAVLLIVIACLLFHLIRNCIRKRKQRDLMAKSETDASTTYTGKAELDSKTVEVKIHESNPTMTSIHSTYRTLSSDGQIPSEVEGTGTWPLVSPASPASAERHEMETNIVRRSRAELRGCPAATEMPTDRNKEVVRYELP